MIVLIFITISIFIAAADFDIIRQHHSVVINITTIIFSMTPLSPSLKFIIIITILIIITIHHAYHHHPHHHHPHYPHHHQLDLCVVGWSAQLDLETMGSQ